MDKNTKFLLRFGAICLLCSLIGLPLSHASNQATVLNPTGRDIEIVSLLKVSDSVLGEALITITAQNTIELPKQETLNILSDWVSENTLKTLAQSNQTDSLSNRDFLAAGLDLQFDMSALECVITIPSDASKTRQLSLEASDNHFNYMEPELFSGFINIALGAQTNHSLDDERNQSELYRSRLDAALNIGWLNLEYEASLEKPSDSDAHYLREGTRFNIDFPQQGTRLVVGDMYNSGKLFQGATDILGVGITRDFTLIPTRNVRPKANQSFTLQRTSSVDVVVDGVVIQRLTLGAGTYNLSDIPLAQGNNDIELVIIDSTGQEERIQFSIATGNDLLAQGEFEYSLMYGVPSELNQQNIDYLTEQKLLHGYFDYGFMPWLTLGINGQKREQLHQYGGTLLFASRAGISEISASQSDHPELGKGEAYRLAFDAEFSSDNQLQPQFSLIYEYLSANFAGVAQYDAIDAPLNSVSHYLSAFGSLYLTDTLRGALSFNYNASRDEKGDYYTVSPSLSGPFFTTPATWSARFNYRNNQYDDDEWGTTLTLSWPFGKTTRVVSRYSSQVDQASIDYTYQEDIGNSGGVSAFASLSRDRDVDTGLDMGVNYTGNRFIAIADHTTRVESFDQNTRNHTNRLDVSSAIAFAGTHVTIGRPVREAFAIVTKHESLKDNRLSVEPSNDGKTVRVYSEGNLDALVPDLVAYNSRLLTYDVDDLPPGYDLGDGAFWLNPGYKRGYLLQVGSDAVLTVMGTLIDKASKQPIPLVAGYAIYLGEQPQEPIEFFTNRNGLFAISGLRPGEYKLELNNAQKQSVTLSVDSRNEVLIRLGELYVD